MIIILKIIGLYIIGGTGLGVFLYLLTLLIPKEIRDQIDKDNEDIYGRNNFDHDREEMY